MFRFQLLDGGLQFLGFGFETVRGVTGGGFKCIHQLLQATPIPHQASSMSPRLCDFNFVFGFQLLYGLQ